MKSKTCRKCGLIRSVEAFSKDIKNPDLRRNICRNCDNLRSKRAVNICHEIVDYRNTESPWSRDGSWVETRKSISGIKNPDGTRSSISYKPGPDLNTLSHPSPVKIECSWKPTVVKSYSKSKVAVVFSDAQFGYNKDLNTGELDPYHDRKAWDVAFQICERLNPDTIVYIGDMLDCAEFSDKFQKTPEMYFTFQAALEEFSWETARLRSAVPNASMHYIGGNHDDSRITRTMDNKMVCASSIKRVGSKYPALSIPALMNLEDIGVKWHGDYPNGCLWLNDNFRLSHGEVARSGSGKSVAKILDSCASSEGTGHIHRAEMCQKTIWRHDGPSTYLAASFGTLARLDGPCPKAASRPNWQNAIGIIEYEEGNGLFDVHIQSINKGETLFRGEKLVGRNLVKQLSKDLNRKY